MNHTEATHLVTVLNRACLVPAMEGQGAVWQMALADVPFVTATAVATRMVATRTSEQRWVTPGDIRTAVQTQRQANLARMATPQPPEALDGDPARELAWQRAYRAAYADTGDHDHAQTAACTAVGTPVPAPSITAPRPPELAPFTAGATCEHACLRPVAAEESAA